MILYPGEDGKSWSRNISHLLLLSYKSDTFHICFCCEIRSQISWNVAVLILTTFTTFHYTHIYVELLDRKVLKRDEKCVQETHTCINPLFMYVCFFFFLRNTEVKNWACLGSYAHLGKSLIHLILNVHFKMSWKKLLDSDSFKTMSVFFPFSPASVNQ